MSPKPFGKPKLFSRTSAISPDEEIVISGIAGRFPNSRNMTEFSHNLYNKIDMVDDLEVRWRHFNPEIPKRMGKISDLDKFDPSVFDISYKQAHAMDPQMRTLVEHSFEAILDAGVNPKTIHGSRTGVFIGACFAESEKTWYYEQLPPDGLGLTGCARSILASRISYTLGINGPCHIVDTACSSSMYALDRAFHSIRSGECDAAIVGGCNLVLHPYVTLQFFRLGVLAADGYCRPFDQDASGYTRSEAVGTIFLQKMKDAKRNYATIVYTKTNCDGYKEQGVTYPSGHMQAQLLSEFYEEIKINPATVDYIEAHSTGTYVGDPEECVSLDKIFCKGRTTPLPVGSIKSNIGHAEATSGLCSIAKVVLAFHNNVIPPNINYVKYREGITSLEEGRLQVITEPTQLTGPLICINSFGFGGANAHALFKNNCNVKVNEGIPKDSLPRLVLWSGRTADAIHSVLNDIEKRPLDAEFVALLHNIQHDAIPTNIFRGFGVYAHVPGSNALCLNREFKPYTGLKRKLVWVFSGLGIEWIDVGTSLMLIPIFRSSIERCHQVLLDSGLDLIDIVTSGRGVVKNIVHSFVGIVAIQIGLVDLLKSLKMTPDYLIGHSIGEFGCAYADNCLTLEQTILSAFAVGRVALENQKKQGAMAVVGLGYRKLRGIIPNDIEVACSNGPDSTMITGPLQSVTSFTDQLKKKKISVRNVECSNIPFHSKQMASLEMAITNRLNTVIQVPATRSQKWLSTRSKSTNAKSLKTTECNGAYFARCLVNQIHLEETLALLPRKSLTLEIAPHDLLHNCLKSLMTDGVHLSALEKANQNNIHYFLNSLGRLYSNGLDFHIANLYPAVKFPVAAKTPMISPLIKWEHSEDWYVTSFENVARKKSCINLEKINLSLIACEYLVGHTIDGRILFPATGYLFLAWEALALLKGPFFFDLPVQFEDVKFHRATSLVKNTDIEFSIIIQPGTGKFEITEGSSSVVTGSIIVMEQTELTTITPPEENDLPVLETKDFYKELRLRGYHYNGLFKSVVQARMDGLQGKVKWNNSWVAFMDCLLQIEIIGRDSRNLLLPIGIQKMKIDPMAHLLLAKKMPDPTNQVFDVHVSKDLNTLRCGGIEICGLHASPVGRRKAPGFPVLESYKFIPHIPTPQMIVSDAIRMCVQLALENVPTLKVKAVEMGAEPSTPIINYFLEALGDLPLVTSELLYLSNQEVDIGSIPKEDGKLSEQTNCLFIIDSNVLEKPDFAEKATESLSENGFIVSRESADLICDTIVTPPGYQLICVMPVENETLVLLQQRQPKVIANSGVLKISTENQEYLWIDEVRAALKTGPVMLLSENEPYSGLIGLVNCIRKEPEGHLVSCIYVDDPNAPTFDIDDPTYKSHLKLGLAINVYRNGRWGSYRHVQLITEYECKPRTNHNYANALVKGDLSSLTWLDGSFDISKPVGTMVKVAYASLNFRDVMIASGKLSADVFAVSRIEQECVLGFEFSGVSEDGQRIMGMVISGALASHVVYDISLAWRCPDDWTLAEAATIPVVYSTVYSAFFLTTKISAGKSILIHAGSGGIGLAAIRVALSYGLEVFTTVSTPEKKQFVLDTFPTLKEENIGNSRDTSFEAMVMIQTEGNGVDFVLNSLADEKLQASVRCLGKNGVFLEIGKFDMANDSKLNLADFKQGISFCAVLVDNLFHADYEEKLNLRNLVQKDIDRGTIIPLKTTIFPAHEVEQAYRYLGAGKHVGKVLLKLRENEDDDFTLPITVQPRVYCHPALSYIIPGGLGGFGLELADWLILRGCRKLVLSSSRGITKQYQAYRIKIWENYGVKISVNTDDISTREGCESLIRKSMKMGPVGGVFNLAVVLRDAIFENQDAQKFVECMAPKAVATKHLDELTRALCPKLHYFVVFSSVSCGRGNAGQTNYGMANSVMERIMERRHKDGLPAKAVQWGAVGEVGLVADMQEDKLDMEIGGTLQQRISSCLQELDPLLQSPEPLVSSMVVAEKRVRGDASDNIIETVMNIMSIRDIKSISMDSTLSELGMDSLMAVEIKQTLERDFDLCLTPQDLRALTFSKLKAFSEAKSLDNTQLKFTSAEIPTGLSVLLRQLGDEQNSDQTILHLESTSKEVNMQSCVLITPGVEGVAGHAWKKIATELNHQAFILQLTQTSDLTSIDEIVDFVIDEIKQEVIKENEKFYLVGYSFGALVTLEIARRLEKMGKVGHVLLIDGAPRFLKQLTIEQMPGTFTDASLQLLLMVCLARMIFPEENADIIRVIGSCETWEDKLLKLLEFSKDQSIYTEEYIRRITNAIFLRMKMAVNVDLDNFQPIKSPITLVRPTEASVVDIIEDYGLSAYTEGGVTMKFIEGNHSTMLDNIKLSYIINDIATI